MVQQQIGASPASPWGDDPPPAPSAATRAERRKVSGAWRSWSHFRPFYTRDGDVVEAEVNLKDRIFRGTGTGSTEAEAAWAALQDCIKNWSDSVAIELHLLPKPLRSWLHRR